MKIKHWQGYGCITATKTRKVSKNGRTTLVIHVSGNHECGLHRDDEYDVANWLIKRFDKTFTDVRDIESMSIEDGYDDEKHEETCDYTIIYRTRD